MSLLEVKNLKTYFRSSEGTAKAVDDISFSIEKGQFFSIVGESGCGKTVTALSIMQLITPPAGYIAGGEIFFDGQEIVKLSEKEKQGIRGNKISMVFQEPMTSLNPVFTVGYQIIEPIKLHQKMNTADAKNKAIEMLKLVGIPDPEKRYYEYPHQLSGGMKQRVMIAIALACQSQLLIADEPTTALDVTIQAQILNLMKDLQKQFGMAILYITHDLSIVRQTADKTAVMYAGKIVEQCDTDELFMNPLHPYTIKLFESLPEKQKRGRKLENIKGTVPKATRFKENCRFADRCDKAGEICHTTMPQLIEFSPGHFVSCYLYDEHVKNLLETRKTAETVQKLFAEPDTGTEKNVLVKVRGLKKYFPVKKGLFKRTVGHVKAVDGINLDIYEGKTCALVGESGCGKTTAGKSIIRLFEPSAGSIFYQDVDITPLHSAGLLQYKKLMQIIFQDPYSSLNPRIMIGDSVEEGLKVHHIGKDKKERMEIVVDILKKVGLQPDILHRYPHEFSGGQRQRIYIARALAVNPKFIVCDEATSSLDVSVQAQILNLLKELQHEFSLTYLLITHNLSVVEYFADMVCVMYLGRIVEEGKTDEIFEHPNHPYTKILLESVPRTDVKTGLKKIILEGEVPSPINPPQGCHFHPRCPKVMDICRSDYPVQSTFSDTHNCFCHLYKN